MAVSIAVGVGDGVLRGRMARASRARRVLRRAPEMCGRVGIEVSSDIEIELLDDDEDSGSKRAERMEESRGVSCEVGVIVAVAIPEAVRQAGLTEIVQMAVIWIDNLRGQFIDLGNRRAYPPYSDKRRGQME